MILDLLLAATFLGGVTTPAVPIEVSGLHVMPPTEALSTQATGTGATVLRAAYSGGRVRFGGKVVDFTGDEVIVSTTSAQFAQFEDGATVRSFTSGNAVWFTLVAVQTKINGAVRLVWVPGNIAAVANAVVATQAEIRSFLELDDVSANLVVLGDIRFYRSADQVVQVMTSAGRRPAYVYESDKSTTTQDANSPDGMEEVFWGYLEVPITYASAYALNAGEIYAAPTLPPLPYGGKIRDWEVIGAVSGAGAGADMTLKLQIDSVEVTGSSIQLLLAGTAIAAGGAKINDAGISANNVFKPGSTLGIEVDAKPTAFTAGSGSIRIQVWQFVPPAIG